MRVPSSRIRHHTILVLLLVFQKIGCGRNVHGQHFYPHTAHRETVCISRRTCQATQSNIVSAYPHLFKGYALSPTAPLCMKGVTLYNTITSAYSENTTALMAQNSILRIIFSAQRSSFPRGIVYQNRPPEAIPAHVTVSPLSWYANPRSCLRESGCVSSRGQSPRAFPSRRQSP